MHRPVSPRILLSALALTASAQQLAFTSRNDVQSPAAIVSTDSSKEYGFESVTLRNDTQNTIAGFRFEIVLRTEGDDAVADERHFTVRLDPHETKRIDLGLADIQSLKQMTKARHRQWALAILTIEAVEFSNGGEWKRSELEQGTPLDPLVKPPELRQREK